MVGIIARGFGIDSATHLLQRRVLWNFLVLLVEVPSLYLQL
jgi:hypothetical protein